MTFTALFDPFATEKEVDGIPVFTDKAWIWLALMQMSGVDFTMPAKLPMEITRFAFENGFEHQLWVQQALLS